MKNIIEKDENISMLHAQGTTIVLFTYVVPPKSKMVLTHFSNYLSLAGHWTHVMWSIRKNGVGINPYNTLTDEIGVQTEPRKIRRLEFQGGDVLIINATDDNTIGQPPNLRTGIAIKYETGY